jgi:predicted small lipoprotein YifL
MKKRLALVLAALILTLTLAACGSDIPPPETTVPPSPSLPSAPETPETSADPEPSAAPDIVDSDIVGRVLRELTRPEYNGRVSGSEEIVKAAHFLAGVFSEIGLLPCDSGSFIMEYSNSDPGIRYFGDELSNAKGYNVVGVIPGTDRAKALVVSAHYDAVSIGGGQGALDNASGVAAILRVAESLLRWGEQPETDIIFCAFDGEEHGLLGSQAFVLNAKEVYQEMFNINIDTIGLSGVPLLIAGDEILREDITAFFADSNIPLDYENMVRAAGGTMIFGSDDTSFRNHGFSGVTLANLGDEVFAVMHSENDVPDVLDIAFIENTADVVTGFIIENQGVMY